MLLLALMAWPIVKVGPVFFAEARRLALLEATGVRVDSTCVRDVRRYDLRETELSELSFVFSPDPVTAEPWEITDIWALDPARREAYFDRITAGRPPRGWYRGQAILYDSTAKEIERDDSRRFVTYLRDDPTINTIGPITWARVWLTWLAGGKGVFMAVMAGAILVYLALVAFRDVLRSRMRRRRDSL